MRMRDFIKTYREELDKAIRKGCPNIGKITDEERRQWILNDEGLYRWARSKGVKV